MSEAVEIMRPDEIGAVPPGTLEVPHPGPLDELWRVARRVHLTDFVPTNLRGKPEGVVAVFLAGREVGLGPMASLRHIFLINGRTATSAELMRAIVRARGHSITKRESDNDHCVLLGRRADNGDTETVTWSTEDAARAGLVKKGGPWEQYPRAMLLARATAELCRSLFADCLGGLSYTPEELGGEPLAEDLS